MSLIPGFLVCADSGSPGGIPLAFSSMWSYGAVVPTSYPLLDILATLSGTGFRPSPVFPRPRRRRPLVARNGMWFAVGYRGRLVLA